MEEDLLGWHFSRIFVGTNRWSVKASNISDFSSKRPPRGQPTTYGGMLPSQLLSWRASREEEDSLQRARGSLCPSRDLRSRTLYRMAAQRGISICPQYFFRKNKKYDPHTRKDALESGQRRFLPFFFSSQKVKNPSSPCPSKFWFPPDAPTHSSQKAESSRAKRWHKDGFVARNRNQAGVGRLFEESSVTNKPTSGTLISVNLNREMDTPNSLHPYFCRQPKGKGIK